MATTSKTMSCIVVSPDKIIFEGEVERLMAPGLYQEIAILPRHTPLYAQLKQGQLVCYEVNKAPKTIDIESGILRVKLNRISIIVGFDTPGTFTTPQ